MSTVLRLHAAGFLPRAQPQPIPVGIPDWYRLETLKDITLGLQSSKLNNSDYKRLNKSFKLLFWGKICTKKNYNTKTASML